MKAISPIIATVLLIALVVVTAGIVNTWVYNFTKTSTKDIKKEATEQAVCAKAEISLNSLRYCNNFLSGIIYNDGAIALGNLTLHIIYQNGSQEKFELNDSAGDRLALNAGYLATFNISVSSNYDSIIILTNCTDKTDEKERNEITAC